MASENDLPWKIARSRKLDGDAWRDAAEIFDEIALGTGLVAHQGRAEQSAMRFFDGNPLRGRATAEPFHDGGFEVADEQLSHEPNVLSMIAPVKCRRAGVPFVLRASAMPGGPGMVDQALRRPGQEA